MKYRIFDGAEEINTIEADADFAASYCEENGYTCEEIVEPEPEPAPTQLDRVEAQAAYTAMMTDTLLEV